MVLQTGDMHRAGNGGVTIIKDFSLPIQYLVCVLLLSNLAVLGTVTQDIMNSVGDRTMSVSSILYSTSGGRFRLLHML